MAEARQFEPFTEPHLVPSRGAQALDQLADYTDSRCITLDTYDLDAIAARCWPATWPRIRRLRSTTGFYGQRNLLIESAYSNLRIGQLFRASQFVFPPHARIQAIRAIQ